MKLILSILFAILLTNIIITNAIAALAQDLPKNRPHIRIFRNFGTPDEIIRNKYDLSFYPEVNQDAQKHIGLKYVLNAYMMAPREKSSRLKEWWCTHKLNKTLNQCIFPDTWLCENTETCDVPEEMFLHFKEDTLITLDLGVAFLYEGYRTGVVNGWDPENFIDSDNDGFIDIDTNKDGNISDSEWATRPNKNAGARAKQDARIPCSYWGKYWEYLTGEPVDHYSVFLMNPGNQDYLEFMSEIFIPDILNDYNLANGIYLDDSLGSAAKKWTTYSEIVEYDTYNDYYNDNFYLLENIKQNIPLTKIVIGNQWDNSMPIDGMQRETWMDITYSYKSTVKSLKNALDLANLRNSQGLIFLAQYSPAFHSEYARTGPDVPVTRERDQLYALGSYYLVAGERSYFGYGNPPYQDDGNLLFEAIDFDIGSPSGDFFVLSGQGKNILKNSGFEDADTYYDPLEWIASEPVEIDSTVKKEGTHSVRIDSITVSNNNSNGQSVTLKPHTTYTLSGYIKTLNITGPYQFSGANFYPYDFSDSFPEITGCMASLSGTNDWTFLYCTFTTGNDVEGNIYFRIMYGTGTAWFDSIELLEGEPKLVLGRKYSKALVLVRPRADENAGYEDPVVYNLRNSYQKISADGGLNEPSNSVTLYSGEAAILACTYWDGNTYIDGMDCISTPPSVPMLISPANIQTGLDTTVTFRWNHSRYPDENTMTYSLTYCTNEDFTGCSPILVSSRSDQNSIYAMGGNLSHLIILGMVFTGGITNRRKFTFLIAVLLIAGGMLLSCGGGGSGSATGGAIGSGGDGISEGGNSSVPEISYSVSEHTYTVSGLSSATTYYWKITADNGNGGTTDSEIWSFNTR